MCVKAIGYDRPIHVEADTTLPGTCPCVAYLTTDDCNYLLETKNPHICASKAS